MLKMRVTENDLLEDESATVELYGSPRERVDDNLQSLFLAYAEEPVSSRLLDLAHRLENALCSTADIASPAGRRPPGRVYDPRRFYH